MLEVGEVGTLCIELEAADGAVGQRTCLPVFYLVGSSSGITIGSQ